MEPQPDCGEACYEELGKLTIRVVLAAEASARTRHNVALAFVREGIEVHMSYLLKEERGCATVRWVKKSSSRPLACWIRPPKRRIAAMGDEFATSLDENSKLNEAAAPHTVPGSSQITRCR